MLLVVGVAASPTAAAPHGGSGDEKVLLAGPLMGDEAELARYMEIQGRLDRAADRIRAAGRDVAGSGFSGDRVDVPNNRIILYWHGKLNAELVAEIERVRATGITVDVQEAAYTLTELLTERDRLSRLSSTLDGVQIVTVGPRADGNGLEVGVAGKDGGALSRVDQQRLAATLDSAIPLSITNEAPPVAGSRYYDSEPYWGGAYAEIYNAQGQVQAACSTGFGVAGNNGAARYLLTAAHCGVGQWRTGRVNGQARVIGDVIPTRDLGHDAELVLTNAGTGVYEGPSIATGDTFTGRAVLGASANRVGDSICTSGAFSGTICGYVIAATNQTINIGGFGQVTAMVRAEAPNRASGIGNGDSGGPVYVTDGSAARARGIISAYSGDQNEWVGCAGVPSGPNDDPNARHCAWRWWYGDVTTQIQTLGVHF